MTEYFRCPICVSDAGPDFNNRSDYEGDNRHRMNAVVKIADLRSGHGVWVKPVNSEHDRGTDVNGDQPPKPAFHINDFEHDIYIIDRDDRSTIRTKNTIAKIVKKAVIAPTAPPTAAASAVVKFFIKYSFCYIIVFIITLSLCLG